MHKIINQPTRQGAFQIFLSQSLVEALFFSRQERIYFLETSNAIKADPQFPIITTSFKFGIHITRDKLCQATSRVRTSTHRGCSQFSKDVPLKWLNSQLPAGFRPAHPRSCSVLQGAPSVRPLFLLGPGRRWLVPTETPREVNSSARLIFMFTGDVSGAENEPCLFRMEQHNLIMPMRVMIVRMGAGEVDIRMGTDFLWQRFLVS